MRELDKMTPAERFYFVDRQCQFASSLIQDAERTDDTEWADCLNRMAEELRDVIAETCKSQRIPLSIATAQGRA